MAIFNVIKYNGPNQVLVWKYPKENITTRSKLIVNQSQEALLLKGGEAMDLFGPGTYTLSTDNIPILNSIINLPFGGKTPFTVEIFYFNKQTVLDVKWGTSSPIQLQDPKYHILVPVRSYGQFGIKIEDSRKFVEELIGTTDTFLSSDLADYFKGLLGMKIKDLISSYLVYKKVSILEMNAHLDELSDEIKTKVSPEFEKFGIRIVNFYVNSINVPESDPSVGQLKKALAKKAEMDVIGYSYNTERTFNTLDSAARNESSVGSSFMGAGIGLGVGAGVVGAFKDTISEISGVMGIGDAGQNQMRHKEPGAINGKDETQPNGTAQTIECIKCKTPLPSDGKFCIGCGKKLFICGSCGADNEEGSESCLKCGNLFPVKCQGCDEEFDAKFNFCPKCGKQVEKPI